MALKTWGRLALVLWCCGSMEATSFAEQPAATQTTAAAGQASATAQPQQQQPVLPTQSSQGQAAQYQIRKLAVLPTTDTSDLNLGVPLQYSLSALYQQTQYYNVQFGSTALPGFTEADIARAFQTLGVELISFCYLEPERISVFLFDVTHPKEFIVVAQNLIDPMMGNSVNQQVVDYKFRMAFNEALGNFYQGKFQPLPGTQVDKVIAAAEQDEPRKRAEDSKRLFRELAALQEGKAYLGADIGMARFAGGPSNASTVNFGAYYGRKMTEKLRLELGLDVFSYALMHLDARYNMAFGQKYVTIQTSFGLGTIIGTIQGPRFDFEASLNTGGLMFGPGISFVIPLLGASVRGELKYYLGGGSVLLGTYGLSYSI